MRPAIRWLLYVAAGALMTMALLVGLVRLLLPLVPDYQEDIRAWASTATGYDISFERIRASWPLAGPQLTLSGVQLSRPGDTEAILAARELTAGISIMRLLRDGRPALGRLSISGASVRIERTAGGEWRVQGRRLADLLPKPQRGGPPELEIELGDIDVRFLDVARAPQPLGATVERLRASLEPERLAATARLRLPPAFGNRLEVELDTPMPLPRTPVLPAAWQARLSGTSLDLARIAAYALGDAGPLRAAAGDAVLELAFEDGSAQRVMAQVALDDVGVGEASYEELSGRLEWGRTPAGWDATLEGLQLRRGQRAGPASSAFLRYQAAGETSPERWTGRARFLRLDDLFPLAQAMLAGTEFGGRLPGVLEGNIREIEGEFAAAAEEPSRYSLRASFDRLGVASAAGDLAVRGLSGALAADGDGGRLQIASRDVGLTLSQWFRDELAAETLEGLLIWRAGPDGVRLLSDDIRLRTSVSAISSRLELQFPPDAGSPLIDLKATGSSSDAREVLRYLPLKRFPPGVVGWLERAVVAGRVPEARVALRGPVREFPYEHGEGVFRVELGLEDATLDYANGWPRIEDIRADVVFDGISMYTTSNQGRLGNLPLRNYAVRIPDLRQGMLGVSGGQRTDVARVLEFVRSTPIARTAGALLGRVSGSGPVDASIRLALPVTRVDEYDLRVLFDARGCELALARVPFGLENVRGRVRLHNARFSADAVQATMLGEPVAIRLRPGDAADPQLSHVAELRGSTPVARIVSTFGLPFGQYLSGRADWSADVRIPERRASVPLAISVHSDLREVESSLPLPLTKPAGVVWPAVLELAFPEGDYIDVAGHLEPPFAWNVRLANEGGRWQVERGELHAGPGTARLPSQPGLEVSGRVAELRLGDWLDLGGGAGTGGRPMQDVFRQFVMRIERLVAAGQVFRDVDATARRSADSWAVGVAGPQAQGEIVVPFDTTSRPLEFAMKRLWLLESASGAAGAASEAAGRFPQPLGDPRDVAAARVQADDAAVGQWHLGRLEMDIERTAEGVAASRIVSRAPSFRIEGSGSWSVGEGGRQITRLSARLQGSDIKEMLGELGFDPAIEGESAHVALDLSWPGGPAADFMEHASGRIALEMKNGQVLDLEPGGGGRLLGLLSVAALPRRLALDFSDVFKQGLAFDMIKGDFHVGSGSAYTCNLGLTGPAADIGMVGRTGFGARDYDQIAVVRPQVSNVLTVGGVVLGGPVGGVTMLLISQIFRKPLGTLGESYYRVSGGWDSPDVLRVERSQVDAAEFKDCEREVTAALESGAIALPREAVPGDAPVRGAPRPGDSSP